MNQIVAAFLAENYSILKLNGQAVLKKAIGDYIIIVSSSKSLNEWQISDILSFTIMTPDYSQTITSFQDTI